MYRCFCVHIYSYTTYNANDFMIFIFHCLNTHRLCILVIGQVFIKHLLYLVINWMLGIQNKSQGA